MFDSAWNCVCKRSFTIGDSFPPLLSTKNYLFEVCSRLLGFPPPEFTLLFVTVELFSIIFSFGLFLPCPSKFSHFNKSSARSPKKPWSGLSLFTKSVSTKPSMINYKNVYHTTSVVVLLFINPITFPTIRICFVAVSCLLSYTLEDLHF